jgi:hypothetical protein
MGGKMRLRRKKIQQIIFLGLIDKID